jgi:outer membrane immunogenic protein
MRRSIASLVLPALLWTAGVGTASAGGVAVDSAALDWSGPWIGLQTGLGDLAGDEPFLGVAAGYTFQFDRVVLGVDGEIAGGGVDARRFGGRYEVEALGAIRARIGYAFDRFVAYGAAGVAFASAEFARAGDSDRETHFGWTAGAGLEVALVGGVSARLEYVYVDLDRARFDAAGGASFAPSGGLARVGLNYRF